MGGCIKYAQGRSDTIKGYGVFSFLNDEDGVWIRRNKDGDGGKKSERPRKNAKRASIRTNAIAETGVVDGLREHSAFSQSGPPLLGEQRLSPQPFTPSRLSYPPSMARPHRPMVRFLSSVEPESGCNGVDAFIMLALVSMLAFIGLKKFRRSQKSGGLQKQLMDA